MTSTTRAVVCLAAAAFLATPAVGADPAVIPLPAFDEPDVQLDFVGCGRAAGNAIGGCCDPGPATYFFTEAVFFSRVYDVQQGGFTLFNSTPTLTTPPGTLPNSGSVVNLAPPGDPPDLAWDSTYNPYAYSWSVGEPQLVNTLTDSFGEADQLTGTPRLTLGHVFGNGWGIQGRYWMMENSVGTSAPIPVVFAPTFGGVLDRTTGYESFAAKTIDLEATRDLSWGRWWMLGTLGCRYAEFENTRAQSGVGRLGTGANETGNVQIPDIGMSSNAMYAFENAYGSSMYGTGLTFSLQGLRPIGDSGFALYAAARGSTLWGETESFAGSSVGFDSFYASGTGTATGIGRLNDQTYYIAEAQGGVQWSRYSRWFNGRFFARAGFEYQWWRGLVDQANAGLAFGDRGIPRGVPTAPSTDSGGLPVNSGGSTFPTNPDYLGGIGTTSGGASQSGGIADFDLIGFNVGAGFMW